MSDHFELDPWKSVQGDSGLWYETVELLGVGKNAVAFLVHGTSPSNIGLFYAMKVFRRISLNEAKTRFLEEAAILEKISHPAILRPFDRGTYYTQNPFIVTEVLPLTLRDVISGETATLVQKLAYTLQLAAALKHVNSRTPQVIHRDIKPENIFIRGHACVLGDFGLMKVGASEDALDREILKTSTGPGMPMKYRTPELVKYYNGESTSIGKSDIFQLGLTLAEMFSGQNPQVPAEEYGESIALNPVARIEGSLGAGIAGVLKKMLDVSPSKRPGWDWIMKTFRKIFHDAVDASHVFGRAF